MHEGHRERMRERILKEGTENLQPHEILEYLLYHAIPRKDTNEIAHELINRFGGISEVFSADYENLLDVKGMTKNAALLISEMKGIFKVYSADALKEKSSIRNRGDLVRYLSPVFFGDKTEKFCILCLDAQSNILKLVEKRGIPQEVRVDVRDVVDVALRYKAVSVVIAHNHPSGDVSPSHEDIEPTRAIAAALKLIKVRFADDCIFSDIGYYSFAEDGLGDLIFENVNNFLKDGLKY